MNFYIWFTMLNQITNFRFQKHSDLIGSNLIFGFKRICCCYSVSYDNFVFEYIAEVDAVRIFTSYRAF